jgi:predicted RNase H-like HicB family nuclease
MNKSETEIKVYVFNVVVEPDEDRWHAYCPALEDKGGASWGYAKEEALENIREVIKMTIESMIEHGEQIPEEMEKDSSESLVAVVT